MGFRLPRIVNAKPNLKRSLSFLETTMVAKGHFTVYAGEVDEKKTGYCFYSTSTLGIHLFLSGVACFGFGVFHVAGLYGPRIWVSNPYRLTGKVQPVDPVWGVEGFDPFVPR
ncbi:hypothetical protein Gohar_015965 [Gossypium harknessii]|uniref:Uncharacterized protein n=1 Tax=Gossypium harknessii TaxID=34285 RepID=A0A7J9G1E9_9ROSI|nr:hypothetical protein [Gossypium harknessii]